MTNASAVGNVRAALWRVMVGGAKVKQPKPADVSRRYAEILTESLGQPGFRDLILLVHDLDVRRDLVLAMLSERYRRSFFNRRPGVAGGGERRASEAMDVAGSARDHLDDVLSASLALPLLNDPHFLTFAPDSYWRGETHRLCDRPDGIARLLEEVRAAGVEQVLMVSAWSELTEPHNLVSRRIDGKGRLGEWLAASEVGAVRDAAKAYEHDFVRMFEIKPLHNPIGPFDLSGAYDEKSDRRQGLGELIDRGYADAHRQFIEPVVAASGEEIQKAQGSGLRA